MNVSFKSYNYYAYVYAYIYMFVQLNLGAKLMNTILNFTMTY